MTKPPTGQGEPAVVIEGLTKRFGDFTALDSLSMTLDRGRILGFIGPNGAGKTTTIKILVGLSKPTSGKATICGVDCTSDSHKVKRLVGYMPDVFGAYENMRVFEYLDFFAAAYKVPRKQRLQRINEALDLTGADYMRDRYVTALSHGMKQRVAISRILLHDPQVLILDEPANGLDPTARIEMRQVLLRLADMGKTLIVTSHILPELGRICDTVAIITGGKLRAFGRLDEIMRSLTQRRLMEVVLAKSGDVPKATALLKQTLSADDEITASDAEAEVRFSTDATDGDLCHLLGKLCNTGLKIVQFREVPRDLEDAFLSVTQQTAD